MSKMLPSKLASFGRHHRPYGHRTRCAHDVATLVCLTSLKGDIRAAKRENDRLLRG
jgi:hypothetical protein